MKLHQQTLKQLSTLKRRWTKAVTKDEDKRERALSAIDMEVERRTSIPKRCALPLKVQRELGMISPL